MPLPAREHRQKDVDFKLCPHVLLQGGRIFFGCLNVNLFALPTADHVCYYVFVQSRWASYEDSCILGVRGPSLFAYFSNYLLRGSILKSNIFWHIILSEFVVFSVTLIPATARDGATAMGERYGLAPDSVS